jgi:2-dehydropantoate 2-reductase
MSFRRVFILGAGAIGSCYGALLSGKNDVTLIGNRSHVDAINSRGLAVDGDLKGTFRARAETRLSELPPKSLVILTTKAQDAAKAAGALKPLLRSDTAFLVLQNGLGIKGLIQDAIGGVAEVVRGITLMGAEFFAPGKITCWKGATLIERTGTGEAIHALLRASGMDARLVTDIRKEEWLKLTANCVINPLTAILGVRDSALYAPSLNETRRRIIEECSLVAEAEGVSLGRRLAAVTDSKIRGYPNFSSMHQDLAKGKKTEIGFMNEKIVQLGRKHGIRTPLNEALAGLIRFLETEK